MDECQSQRGITAQITLLNISAAAGGKRAQPLRVDALPSGCERQKRGRFRRPLLSRQRTWIASCLFYVDGFAVRVERAVDANFLALIFFHQILPIDVVCRATGILQYVLVARLHNRACEDLALRLLGLGLGIGRLLSRLIRCLGWRLRLLPPRLAWRLLVRLSRRLLGVESTCQARAERQHQHNTQPSRTSRFVHEILPRDFGVPDISEQTPCQSPPLCGTLFPRQTPRRFLLFILRLTELTA